MKVKMIAVSLLAATGLWAGFDFGQCSGSGSFEQEIVHYGGDYEKTILVGTIPQGIQGLRVELISDKDVDIRLYGENNDRVVHWPYGLLNHSFKEIKSYQDVSVTYSGYNGVDGQKGYEYIEVEGSTPTAFTMKAFGYQTGYARVNYSWTGKDDCQNTKEGSGHFEQKVSLDAIDFVGTIPINIDNLEVNLTSDSDIDIQLYGENGVAIVKWSGGLLNGPSKQEVDYNGMHIVWSGYNGVDGQKGHEYIQVTPKTTEILTMKVYGYSSGYADVDYTWGTSGNNNSDTIAPIITLLGNSAVTVTQGTNYIDAGATANDDVDGDITSSIVIDNPVNVNIIGTYVITYNVSDEAGNVAAEVKRVVTVEEPPDTVAPIISLLGNSSVKITQGTSYVDAGATANDNKDGDITANIVINNPVDISTLGTYVITYNVSDAAGNVATEVKRVVTVEADTSVVTKKLPLLVVRIEFNDVTFTSDASIWANKLYIKSEGSLNDYFNEISYGKFQYEAVVENDVTINDGIVTTKLNMNHPNPGNDGESFLENMKIALTQIDNKINFSAYDSNDDNAISKDELQIMFLVAGGESSTGTSPGIWAHAWCYYGGNAVAPTHDGVRLMNCADNGGYSVFGERHGSSDATMGVMAHELGHATFNLPDLYDVDGGSEGIGNFGLMGSGAWGYKLGDSASGQTPVHMTGWSKMKSGFVEAIELTTNTNMVNFVETSSLDYILYKVATGKAGEYFLIENRGASGYDKGLTSLEGTANFTGGLSILHIDDNINTNADENHKLVDIEEANNVGLDTQAHRGDINNLYFTENADTFNDTSNPNSKRYDGQSSGVSIENISDSAAIMTADITVQ